MSTFLVMSMHETGFSCADMRCRTCLYPCQQSLICSLARAPSPQMGMALGLGVGGLGGFQIPMQSAHSCMSWALPFSRSLLRYGFLTTWARDNSICS